MQTTHFMNWLLESESASIRYLTRLTLLDQSSCQAEVKQEWESLNASGAITQILAGQSSNGSWRGEHTYYTPKYTSTHWSLLLLSELQIDAHNPDFQKGVDFMLSNTKKGFLHYSDERTPGITCFWANLLRYALHGAETDAADVLPIREHLTQDALQMDWRCQYNDDRPCAWGAARALWALAAIPENQRTSAEKETIQSGLSFLLDEFDLLKANYPTPEGGKIHPLWFKLNFPLFYQADILFVLRVLDELNQLKHPKAQASLEWLIGKRQTNLRWRGSSPYRRRTWQGMGESEDTNRWVSLHAAIILEHAGFTIF